MSKQKLTQPINTTQGAEYLLEYQRLLEDKVVALRAEACEIAAKVREIKKTITAEQEQAVADKKAADKAWSMNNGALANFQQVSVVNGK